MRLFGLFCIFVGNSIAMPTFYSDPIGWLDAYMKEQKKFHESILGKIEVMAENQKERAELVKESNAESQRILERAEEVLSKIDDRFKSSN